MLPVLTPGCASCSAVAPYEGDNGRLFRDAAAAVALTPGQRTELLAARERWLLAWERWGCFACTNAALPSRLEPCLQPFRRCHSRALRVGVQLLRRPSTGQHHMSAALTSRRMMTARCWLVAVILAGQQPWECKASCSTSAAGSLPTARPSTCSSSACCCRRWCCSLPETPPCCRCYHVPVFPRSRTHWLHCCAMGVKLLPLHFCSCDQVELGIPFTIRRDTCLPGCAALARVSKVPTCHQQVCMARCVSCQQP